MNKYFSVHDHFGENLDRWWKAHVSETGQLPLLLMLPSACYHQYFKSELIGLGFDGPTSIYEALLDNFDLDAMPPLYKGVTVVMFSDEVDSWDLFSWMD